MDTRTLLVFRKWVVAAGSLLVFVASGRHPLHHFRPSGLHCGRRRQETRPKMRFLEPESLREKYRLRRRCTSHFEGVADFCRETSRPGRVHLQNTTASVTLLQISCPPPHIPPLPFTIGQLSIPSPILIILVTSRDD